MPHLAYLNCFFCAIAAEKYAGRIGSLRGLRLDALPQKQALPPEHEDFLASAANFPFVYAQFLFAYAKFYLYLDDQNEKKRVPIYLAFALNIHDRKTRQNA